MHAKILTHTLTCSILLSTACGDSSAGEDDELQPCVGGQFCPGDLV